MNSHNAVDLPPFADLRDLIAVVTGSSSGIGRAIALELARGGASVIVHGATNREGADATVRDIHELGGKAIARCCDFREGTDALEEFAQEVWNWQARIDILVNNAGADVLTGPAKSLAFDDKLRQLFDIDVAGTMHLSRCLGPRMPTGSAILNIGWDQALTGMEGDSGQLFAASKAAVMAFTQSLAKSLAPKVRVNCLAAGWIKTAWGKQAADEWQQRATRESLLARWGTPEDVAAAARFLVSPAAAFITGQIIAVNGGFRG